MHDAAMTEPDPDAPQPRDVALEQAASELPTRLEAEGGSSGLGAS